MSGAALRARLGNADLVRAEGGCGVSFVQWFAEDARRGYGEFMCLRLGGLQ